MSSPSPRTRIIRVTVLAAGILALPMHAMGAAPGKNAPLRIIVPFPAGASTDYVARLVGQRLGEQTGRTVVVENRTGASGDIAASAVARSDSDGATVLLGAVSLVTNPIVSKKPPFFPSQLIPIGVGVETQLVTISRPGAPAKDIKGLIAQAREKPRGVPAGNAGVATLSHLGMEMLGTSNGVSFNNIPYRGSVPAITDLIAGQTDLMIETIHNAKSYIEAGKVIPLAVHGKSRNPVLPTTPTYAEQGIRGMEFSAWNIFMVPAGTPADIRQALHDAFAKAISARDVNAALLSQGITPLIQSPQASEAFMQAEASRWEQVIKQANIAL